MPIPEANSPWLPAPWGTAYASFRENEAWWLGDVKALQDLYRPTSNGTHTRAGQPHKGGIVGAASRLWWGRPVPANENRTQLHVPAAADVATLQSDLVFAEPPEVRITGDKNTIARLELISGSDSAHATFNHMGEMKSALGSAVLVARWDTTIEDHVWLEAAAADVIIPQFRAGRMAEVTLWTEYVEGHVHFRHLEHHAAGYIEHALFEGTATNLGRRVDLAARPETKQYAGLVNANSVIETGIEAVTAVYNPNLPSNRWRKNGDLAYAGRSDFDQLIPLFDSLDETFSSWIRDLRLGAGRLLVPESALTVGARGEGAHFDAGREIFQGLNVPGDPSKPSLDKVQFDIRVEEHAATMDRIYKEILRKTGLSAASWGDYEGAAITATEVTDRKSASERTRDKKILNDRGAIARISQVALELDGLLFPGKGGGKFHRPEVLFADVSQEDPHTLAQTLSLMRAADSISMEQSVRRWNPDWDDSSVLEEVEKIKAEKGVSVDPTTFDGAL